MNGQGLPIFWASEGDSKENKDRLPKICQREFSQRITLLPGRKSDYKRALKALCGNNEFSHKVKQVGVI